MRVLVTFAALTTLVLSSPLVGTAGPEAGAAPPSEGAREAAPPSEGPREGAPTSAAPAAPGGPAEARPGARPLAGAPPAEDASAQGKPTEVISSPSAPKKTLSHRMQVGLEIGVGAGYSFMVTYRDTTWCGQLDGADNASFCNGMHPVFTDFGLSFGVIPQLDILAEFRLGLMDDLTQNRPIMLMPGLRLWIDADQAFKIGVGFQLIVDLTKQNSSEQRVYGPPVKGEVVDFGGRVFGQFQYDFLRYVGIYAKIDASATARRWLGVNLSGQIGIQARVP